MKPRLSSPPPGHPRRRGESGMVLVAAMLVMAMLAMLSVAGMATSTLEVKISYHDRDAKQAFYLCEAGLEKARYDVVKNWGKGTGSGTFPSFQFEFDGPSMPDILKDPGSPIEWGSTADKWANFTLADQQGLHFRIVHNDPAPNYLITECTGPATQPESDRASLFFEADGADIVAVSQIGEVLATNTDQVVLLGAGWADHQWQGYLLSDRASPPALFEITDNTTDTLTVSGVLPVGPLFPFEIWRAVSGADTSPPTANIFRLYEENPKDHSGDPGRPNAAWNSSFASWLLVDRTGSFFPITGTTFSTTLGGANYMELTVSGSPASGSFQIVTNPWLVEQQALTTAGTPTTWPSITGPSGTNYGDLELRVENDPAGVTGSYLLTATSTGQGTGDAKEIHITARVRRNGQVQLQDWVHMR